MGLQKVLYKALDAQNSGKLADAVRLCLAVLDGHPRNFDAIHLIGIRRSQLGGGSRTRRSAFGCCALGKNLIRPKC